MNLGIKDYIQNRLNIFYDNNFIIKHTSSQNPFYPILGLFIPIKFKIKKNLSTTTYLVYDFLFFLIYLFFSFIGNRYLWILIFLSLFTYFLRKNIIYEKNLDSWVLLKNLQVNINMITHFYVIIVSFQFIEWYFSNNENIPLYQFITVILYLTLWIIFFFKASKNPSMEISRDKYLERKYNYNSMYAIEILDMCIIYYKNQIGFSKNFRTNYISINNELKLIKKNNFLEYKNIIKESKIPPNYLRDLYYANDNPLIELNEVLTHIIFFKLTKPLEKMSALRKNFIKSNKIGINETKEYIIDNVNNIFLYGNKNNKYDLYEILVSFFFLVEREEYHLEKFINEITKIKPRYIEEINQRTYFKVSGLKDLIYIIISGLAVILTIIGLLQDKFEAIISYIINILTISF